jgi:aquaporin Z
VRYRALIAEFVGTFALTFVGVLAIHSAPKEGGLVGIALAHGLTLAVMVSATAAISGGHINPAVTVGAFVARKIDTLNAVGYLIAQFLGAIIAATMTFVVLPTASLSAIHYGTPLPAAGYSWYQLLLVEGVLTFFLMFVVYGTAIDARAPRVGGLFIGLTVALDILAGGPITGAAMNPARFFGPAVFDGSLGYSWLYFIGPLVGAAAAALLYRHTLEERLAPPARQ